jgi:hypothetical protein
MAEGIPGIDYLDAISDKELAELPRMAAACVDCAYTAGTSANLTLTTAEAAAECVAARHPFWCHKTIGALDMPTHLCAGWLARVKTAIAHEEKR